MKKTLIATALAAVIAAPAASAVEIYKDANNEATIGGFFGARLIDQQPDSNHPVLANGGSRINFKFSHKMANGAKVFSTYEWGVNPFGYSQLAYNNDSKFDASNKDFLINRLAFVGFSHANCGTITLGRQWGVWKDVVGNTDNGFVWGGEAAGIHNFAGGAIDGSGMADNAIQYRNSFGDFSFGLQTQVQQDKMLKNGKGYSNPFDLDHKGVGIDSLKMGYTFGASTSYTPIKQLQLTLGGNVAEFDATRTDGSKLSATDYIYGAGITWGDWSNEGLYASASVSKSKWHEVTDAGVLIPNAVGVEAYLAYNFSNGIHPYFIYNHLQANDDFGPANNEITQYIKQYAAVGVHYQMESNVFFYLEGKRDFSDYVIGGKKSAGGNGVALGMRYTF